MIIHAKYQLNLLRKILLERLFEQKILLKN